MTREEAIEILKAWDLNCDEEYSAHEFDVAFNMAIQALQTEQKMGKWIIDEDEREYCSLCQWHPYGDTFLNFCPQCGAKMKEGE